MVLGGRVFLVVTGEVSSIHAATETGRMAAPEAMLMAPRKELSPDGM
jgi:microcompartment protein CcmL/EutN